MNGDLKILENEFKDVQNKQQQRIIQSANLQLNLTATTNNLANKIESLKNELNTVQTKQQKIINRDITLLRSNLTATTNNLANRIDVVDQNLNSTRDKQLELTSNLRNHGHGNKLRIDQLELQIKNFTNDFKLIDHQIETVQQKQIKSSRLSEENEHKIIAMSKNLTDGMNRLDKKLNYTQEKQLELTFDVRSHGHADIDQLTSQIKNFKNDFKLIDQQIETVQQKQMELSHLSEENDQKINVISKNLTDGMNRLDEKLNSTQEKQLKLTSDVRSHGHGNKQRIDQLTSQITNFTSYFEVFDQQVKTVQQQQAKFISKDDLLDRRMNVLWTNITFYMNQIERQAFENITDLSSQMNSTTKKIGLLWMNFLDGKNLIQPITQKYPLTYAESIGAKDPENKTEAVRQEIDNLETDQLELDESKRLVTDRILDSFSIKLHPIDSNLKKVKYSFTVEPFARNK